MNFNLFRELSDDELTAVVGGFGGDGDSIRVDVDQRARAEAEEKRSRANARNISDVDIIQANFGA
jgi:bacteriocin-like protein